MHSYSNSQSYPRHSTLPYSSSTTPAAAVSGSSTSMSAAKTRQYAHLHSQLAQLNAHLADTENLVRTTAVQAADMRFLGGYVGALFMGSAKVLGEEGAVKGGDQNQDQSGMKEGGEGGR
ncbi:DASH complex subunit Hsk3 like-domain-containing protein [Aspergillus varians]